MTIPVTFLDEQQSKHAVKTGSLAEVFSARRAPDEVTPSDWEDWAYALIDGLDDLLVGRYEDKLAFVSCILDPLWWARELGTTISPEIFDSVLVKSLLDYLAHRAPDHSIFVMVEERLTSRKSRYVGCAAVALNKIAVSHDLRPLWEQRVDAVDIV